MKLFEKMFNDLDQVMTILYKSIFIFLPSYLLIHVIIYLIK